MPTCITLVNYTQQGVSKIKDSPARMAAAKKAAESTGGKFLGVYVTLGRYDGVAISEFPNDESYFKFAFYIASLGFLSMETLKALPEEDFGKVISSLG